jgi:hypothetical protein
LLIGEAGDRRPPLVHDVGKREGDIAADLQVMALPDEVNQWFIAPIGVGTPRGSAPYPAGRDNRAL